uniref:ATP-dependent 6-phosphofructokinase n=1 Tax=Trichuris muris TaxID=70415 RepID=A0A5S6QAC3_TRIMR
MSRTPERRRTSGGSQIGHEGDRIHPLTHRGDVIGVFTSGGDSQGMNAALRAVCRMGLYLGCKVYFIHEGYQGMVDGGRNITLASWDTVSDVIQRSGTIIGSARSKDFYTKEGRLKAALNLLLCGINNLVCIGGDGSLTGANIFREEWPAMIKELVSRGSITAEKAAKYPNIKIVGLVGSIDNDFCGTDMTIGTDTALHRIVEAIDAVQSTAQSHQRSFVVEVMGRHCGYLALVAGLASEADWTFIPEWPPPADWRDILCQKLQESRLYGQRINIIICAEGAVDSNGSPITAEMVKNVIVERLNYDTRVTVLGHVQRGGNPSAFDRLLGCRMGAEAVMALMDSSPDLEPYVIAIHGGTIVRVPLTRCVERTSQVKKAMADKDWETAVKLRGKTFIRNLETYKLLTKMRPPKDVDTLSGGHKFTFAVMNIGAPACGMNAAVRSFVRNAISHGCRVFAIKDSFDGLIKGDFQDINWHDVTNWTMSGGSFLGTQKSLPTKDIEKVVSQLRKFKIDGLLLIGGFEAFHSCVLMTELRDKYKEFCIPMVTLPCAISNNIPGTSIAVGSDSALNEICGLIDKIKQSAIGSKRRVFIVETMGGYCGYLATLSALASGADNAYIFEQPFDVDDIKRDVQVISRKMKSGVQRYIIMRCEKANANYTTQFIMQLFSEEGKGKFSTRINVLGHSQQGGCPTPFDRNLATRMAAKAAEKLVAEARQSVQAKGSVYTKEPDSAVLLGVGDHGSECIPILQLKDKADFVHRFSKERWWLKLRSLMRILSGHHGFYEPTALTSDASSEMSTDSSSNSK